MNSGSPFHEASALDCPRDHSPSISSSIPGASISVSVSAQVTSTPLPAETNWLSPCAVRAQCLTGPDGISSPVLKSPSKRQAQCFLGASYIYYRYKIFKYIRLAFASYIYENALLIARKSCIHEDSSFHQSSIHLVILIVMNDLIFFGRSLAMHFNQSEYRTNCISADFPA